MVLENYAYRMLKSPAFTLLFLVLLTPSAAAERGSVVAQFPKWAAPQPDATKPFGGYELMNHSFTSEIYHASPQTFGTYNHNVMVGYLIGTGMVVQWKNCAIDEVRKSYMQRVFLSVARTRILFLHKFQRMYALLRCVRDLVFAVNYFFESTLYTLHSPHKECTFHVICNCRHFGGLTATHNCII